MRAGWPAGRRPAVLAPLALTPPPTPRPTHTHTLGASTPLRSPSPVMAEVGTMLMKVRGSRFFQYSDTFRPCSFSWSTTCRRDSDEGSTGRSGHLEQ